MPSRFFKRTNTVFLLAAMALIGSQWTIAEENSHVDNCEEEQKEQQSEQLVDDISINVQPIFDENNPDENNWLFRTVNYLKINTHESVIRNDLLFKEGDPYDEKLLEESERILRTRRYFNRAAVSASNQTTVSTSNQKTVNTREACTSSKKVSVAVREVWTLLPELTFSHAGGNSNYGFGLRDSNFLGYGKTVDINHTKTSQRSGDMFNYYDPNTGIADTTISLEYANNSDGTEKAGAIIKPFAAFETEWSAGLLYDKLNQEDTLYSAGKEVDRFAHDSKSKSLFYGIRLKASTQESIHRVVLGYSSNREIFSATGTSPNTSIFIPSDREFNYPWFEYQHIHDGYIEAYNIQQINRVEDINLGTEIRVRVGYVSSPFDIYDKSYIVNGDIKRALSFGEDHLILTNLNTTGNYLNGNFYNSKVTGNIFYHWEDFKRGQFFIGITAGRGFHLFKDLPLELGGDTGLRGYPIRYQAGDHLKLVSIEQRFFGQKEWLSLFHMGAAIFYDEGRVWGESAIPQSQTTSLRDIGLGLRLSGTRTGNREEGAHNILHLDLAYPLDGGSDISKVQWIIKVKKGF
jgi:outer membrane protein assembly factor BamA